MRSKLQTGRRIVDTNPELGFTRPPFIEFGQPPLNYGTNSATDTVLTRLVLGIDRSLKFSYDRFLKTNHDGLAISPAISQILNRVHDGKSSTANLLKFNALFKATLQVILEHLGKDCHGHLSSLLKE